jgi:glycosyltransferase involved in cell wall biosynthesis
MNQLHIAVVIGTLRTGGAEKVMIRLANGFAARGIHCSLVVLNDTGTLKADINPDVDLVSLNANRARNGIRDFRLFLRLKKPGVLIVAQTHIQIMALLAVRIEKWEGKFILNEHSLFSHNNRSRLNKFLAKKLFRSADTVTAVSSAVADDFKNSFKTESEIKVINNAAYDPEILTLKNEKINLDDSLPLILTVGRLTKSKNYKLLIDAFEIVLKSKKCKLIFAGEGNQRVELDKYSKAKGISSNVFFIGDVKNPYAYMNRSDVFVMTSAYEGLPTVLIEALACCCNIICVESPGGAREIIINEHLGKFVTPDPDDLANAILESMNKKSYCDLKLNRARDFSVDHAVNKYLEIINQLK